jgi:hypothetical protein
MNDNTVRDAFLSSANNGQTVLAFVQASFKVGTEIKSLQAPLKGLDLDSVAAAVKQLEAEAAAALAKAE